MKRILAFVPEGVFFLTRNPIYSRAKCFGVEALQNTLIVLSFRERRPVRRQQNVANILHKKYKISPFLLFPSPPPYTFVSDEEEEEEGAGVRCVYRYSASST
jgi:hypothetical protein